MKKSFLFLVFILTLSACLKDKKETALENCADSDWLNRYNNQPKLYLKEMPKNIYSEVYKSKGLSLSRGNVESGKLNERNTGEEWTKFAKENFDNTNSELIDWSNAAYKMGLGFKKEKALEFTPPLKIKDSFKDQEKEKIDQFMKLLDTWVTRKKMKRGFENFLNNQIALGFTKLKVTKKFKNESYLQRYQNCEQRYNKLPSSFVNEWEDGQKAEVIKKILLK